MGFVDYWANCSFKYLVILHILHGCCRYQCLNGWKHCDILHPAQVVNDFGSVICTILTLGAVNWDSYTVIATILVWFQLVTFVASYSPRVSCRPSTAHYPREAETPQNILKKMNCIANLLWNSVTVFMKEDAEFKLGDNATNKSDRLVLHHLLKGSKGYSIKCLCHVDAPLCPSLYGSVCVCLHNLSSLQVIWANAGENAQLQRFAFTN